MSFDVKSFKPDLELQNQLKELIEAKYGVLKNYSPIDRDKLFRDIYFDFCEVMEREFDIQLFVARLNKNPNAKI